MGDKDAGLKEDVGKLDWSVFPFEEAEVVVRAFEYGAMKYGSPFTYREGIDWRRLFAATIRHLVAIQKGEIVDNESGVNHTAHVAANALMMISQGR